MATASNIQELIHRMEEGGWAKWIRLAALASAVIYVCYAWLFADNGFKGLSHPRAMEQAEIAREIARGHGFVTHVVRPAELWLLKRTREGTPLQDAPAPPLLADTYHAPLWPAVLSPFLGMVKNKWGMTLRDISYTPDKIVVAVALLFFLLSVVVQYFVAERLFDQRLAVLGMCLMLVCDQFWRFSMSGLPQMMLLFFFSCASYCLVRLIQREEVIREAQTEVTPQMLAMAEGGEESDVEAEERTGLATPREPADRLYGLKGMALWGALAGLSFGLMALGHGLSIWIFVGALLFSAIYFRGLRRQLVPLVMLAVFALCYTPWMVRNYRVSGSPVGVAWYSGLYQIRGTESEVMRSSEPPLKDVAPMVFRSKVQTQLLMQMGILPQLLGYSMLCLAFFLALLHRFKRHHTGMFRWLALLMWMTATFGMTVFGLDDEALRANDLHVLFIPVMSFYGMAYVLVLWSRLEINIRVLRLGFMTLLFLLSGLPFLFTVVELHLAPRTRVAWPPYVPPSIAHLGTITNSDEVIMSDMPWGVAWYADRRALWLPMKVREFIDMNDYNLLGNPVVGLYLTPVSGNRPFVADIMKGEYKEWSPFILRNANLRGFPLKAVWNNMPIDNECVFYADRDRWTQRED